MSLVQINMPHLGESVTEASIAVWLVSEGDKIEKYDPIAEAVSDKVTTEIPSNYSGIVKEFLIDTDTDVEIGTAIMTIEIEGTDAGSGGNKKETEDTEQRKEEFTEHFNKEIEKVAEKNSQVRNTGNIENASRNTGQSEETIAVGKKNPRYSPAVMSIAQEKGIDLQKVEGTGKEGRITRKDVLNFKGSGQGSEGTSQPDERGNAKDFKETESPVYHSSQGDQVVPVSGIRRAIAKKMVQSTTEIPHAWLMVEADVSNIVKLREKTKEAFKEQEGISLSYFPFFVKAVVQALKKFPIMNTSWDNGSIIYHKDINLSIAVATDEHLFVPVIHHADSYSLSGLTKEISRLAKRAREGKLETKDSQGGTITVNNTGSFGSIQSMGIINHPQAAILQVESITKRFVPTEDNGFKAADMVNLCLSIDHRIIDGLQAGRFLKEIKENLLKYTDESDLS